MPRLVLLLPLCVSLASACRSSDETPGAPRGEAGSAGDSALSGAAGAEASSVSLAPKGGWLDGSSNALGIQGAAFVAADDFTGETLESDLEGSRLCMRGTARQVDLSCTPASPGTDCFDLHWGAALVLNLNQADASDTPLPYDASAFAGFTFDLVGPVVPHVRFSVETSDASYCLPLALEGEKPGTWEVGVEQLVVRCHQPRPNAESASSAKPQFTALRWTVGGDYTRDVPFDLCLENLRVRVD